MELVMRGHGIRMNAALSGFCRRIVTGGLDRLRGRLRQVLVFVEDVNGPRGGVDKHCRLVLAVTDGHSLVVESVAADVASAIVDATHRAKQSLARRLARLRTSRRRNRGQTHG